ncbi:MAG: hypothetical protein WBN04_16385 [Paracoccaceae bacterium]
MARAKKSITKPDESSAENNPVTEQMSAISPDDVEDAVILEEADQAGVPEVESSDSTESVETGARLEPISSEPKAVDPTVTRRSSGGGVLALLLGGLAAGALGFGVSQYLGNDSWPFSQAPSVSEQLAERIESQTARMDALTDEVKTVQGRLSEVTTSLSAQDDVQQAIARLTESVDAFERRLTDLENRPIPDVGATREAVAAYQDQLAGMRAMFEKELAGIEAAQTKAAEKEQTAAQHSETALARAALTGLQAAIESGAPFADLLNTLSGVGVEVPADLALNATQGVPTLAALQQSYPVAAREALNASIQARADSGEIDRFTAFLRTQLGSRSLEPKEGADPDAILSRAESALRDGNLPRAMSELKALPEAGASAMAGWIATAQSRLDAVAAVTALSEKLNN